LDTLKQHGASFFIDIVKHSGQLRTQVEASLAELAVLGRLTSDSFAGLRALITPALNVPVSAVITAAAAPWHRATVSMTPDAGR
jgi:hypothetical protein